MWRESEKQEQVVTGALAGFVVALWLGLLLLPAPLQGRFVVAPIVGTLIFLIVFLEVPTRHRMRRR